MTQLRTVQERKADVLAALERQGDGWLSTASRAGGPHLIAVAVVWDEGRLIVATRGDSPTARNAAETRRARLALGSPDDVVMIDVELLDDLPATPEAGNVAAVFERNAGWDPGQEPGGWRYLVFRPVRIQAYRGYGESAGRDVMRDGRWLA